MDLLQTPVTIIGGGITALSIAWRLAENAIPFVILEREPRLGGQIRTLNKEGFIIETGPNTGTISHPEVRELFAFAGDKVQLEVAKKTSKRRLIVKNNAYHALPSGPFSALFTPLFTFYDKIRILGEPFRKPIDNPTPSVGEFVKYRMGKSFLKYAVDPFISGVYASDPFHISVKHAFPKLYNLEAQHGSFIRGAWAKRKEHKSERDKLATKEVFSAYGGFSQLTDALVEKLQNYGTFIADANVQTVEQLPDGWKVTCKNSKGELFAVKSEYYVTTVRADNLPNVLPETLQKSIAPITQMQYAPVIEVALGFANHTRRGKAAFGALVPTVEPNPILGVLFPSDCFSDRVPGNCGTLYSVFMGGTRYGDMYFNMSDQELVDVAMRELTPLERFPQNLRPTVTCVSRHRKAIPQYDLQSDLRLQCIAALQDENKGLILAGGIRDGIGMSHRIKQGSDIGLSIANALKMHKDAAAVK